MTWEKELVAELDITWGDAHEILKLAKEELGIDADSNPEDSKEAIFEKCRTISAERPKTPKLKPVKLDEEKREEAKKLRGEGDRADTAAKGFLALCCCCMIFGD